MGGREHTTGSGLSTGCIDRRSSVGPGRGRTGSAHSRARGACCRPLAFPDHADAQGDRDRCRTPAHTRPRRRGSNPAHATVDPSGHFLSGALGRTTFRPAQRPSFWTSLRTPLRTPLRSTQRPSFWTPLRSAQRPSFWTPLRSTQRPSFWTPLRPSVRPALRASVHVLSEAESHV